MNQLSVFDKAKSIAAKDLKGFSNAFTKEVVAESIAKEIVADWIGKSLGFKNRDELEKSFQCSCFFCFSHFNVTDVDEWVDDDETAICPHCDIDSVIERTDLKTLKAIHKDRF